MNRDTLRQIAVIVITVVTLVVNGLATALPLNNVTTRELSDMYLVRFVPAGYVFAVWGIIYIGFMMYSIYQGLNSQRTNPRLQKIGWWFVVGSVANSLWLVFWHHFQVEVTMVMMLILLATLIYTVITLVRMPAASLLERIMVDIPFHIYTGWISVATIVNVTVLLDKQGVKNDGLGIWLAIGLTGIAVVLALLQRWWRRDTAYGFVIAWALYGVGVKQIEYATSGTLPAAPLLVLVTQSAAYALAGILAVWWVVSQVRTWQQARA